MKTSNALRIVKGLLGYPHVAIKGETVQHICTACDIVEQVHKVNLRGVKELMYERMGRRMSYYGWIKATHPELLVGIALDDSLLAALEGRRNWLTALIAEFEARGD